MQRRYHNFADVLTQDGLKNLFKGMTAPGVHSGFTPSVSGSAFSFAVDTNTSGSLLMLQTGIFVHEDAAVEIDLSSWIGTLPRTKTLVCSHTDSASAGGASAVYTIVDGHVSDSADYVVLGWWTYPGSGVSLDLTQLEMRTQDTQDSLRFRLSELFAELDSAAVFTEAWDATNLLVYGQVAQGISSGTSTFYIMGHGGNKPCTLKTQISGAWTQLDVTFYDSSGTASTTVSLTPSTTALTSFSATNDLSTGSWATWHVKLVLQQGISTNALVYPVEVLFQDPKA